MLCRWMPFQVAMQIIWGLGHLGYLASHLSKGNKERDCSAEWVHQIHWHFRNSLTPLVCVSPSTCHFSVRWLCGRREKVHLSFWERSARPDCPAGTNVSLLIDESWSGGKEREEKRAGERAEHHGGLCAALVSSLWSSDIFPSTVLVLSAFTHCSYLFFPFPAHGYTLLLQPNTNYLTFIAAPVRPYKQVKKRKQTKKTKTCWDKWASFSYSWLMTWAAGLLRCQVSQILHPNRFFADKSWYRRCACPYGPRNIYAFLKRGTGEEINVCGTARHRAKMSYVRASVGAEEDRQGKMSTLEQCN